MRESDRLRSTTAAASKTNSPRIVARQANTRALNKPRDFVSTLAFPSIVLVAGEVARDALDSSPFDPPAALVAHRLVVLLDVRQRKNRPGEDLRAVARRGRVVRAGLENIVKIRAHAARTMR